MNLRKRFTQVYVAALLHMSAWLARREWLNRITHSFMRFLAGVVIRQKQIKPQTTLSELGQAWQQAFPSVKHHPITKIDDTTVYGEIHTNCPLRGTGDVHACHRMMEFDRTIARQAGGEFVVLRSQSEPGVTVCQVAMRLRGSDTSDLQPAHQPSHARS
ncbi:MAG: hypothetical protein HY774_19660 [Acidobacteria bacterium]|nr:hypothetical protein [Acidobacteriota bacterium]